MVFGPLLYYFIVYCTSCTLLVVHGCKVPVQERDHPDFCLSIGNLDSENWACFHFFLHLRLFYFLFLVCTVHCASSWFSMVSIDLCSSLVQGEIILILVSVSATWILQTGRIFIFSSLEIILFSFCSAYCTLCILLIFIGFHRPGLKVPYAERDHPDFGLRIGNLDSLQTRERYALIQLLMEFRIS